MRERSRNETARLEYMDSDLDGESFSFKLLPNSDGLFCAKELLHHLLMVQMRK